MRRADARAGACDSATDNANTDNAKAAHCVTCTGARWPGPPVATRQSASALFLRSEKAQVDFRHSLRLHVAAAGPCRFKDARTDAHQGTLVSNLNPEGPIMMALAL